MKNTIDINITHDGGQAIGEELIHLYRWAGEASTHWYTWRKRAEI